MKLPIEQPEVPHRRAHHGGGGTRRDHIVTTTAIVGVALFLIFGAPYLKRHMASDADATAGSSSIGDDRAADSRLLPRDGRDRDRDGRADADREAVRRWLIDQDRAGNVARDKPRIHEIRWWPARELTELYQQRLEAAEAAADDDPELADRVALIKDQGPDRVCRLKYSTTTADGDAVAHDDVFLVQDGQVRRLSKNSSLANAARRVFPESQGLP